MPIKPVMFHFTDVEMGEKQIKRASPTNAMYILQNGYLCDSHWPRANPPSEILYKYTICNM